METRLNKSFRLNKIKFDLYPHYLHKIKEYTYQLSKKGYLHDSGLHVFSINTQQNGLLFKVRTKMIPHTKLKIRNL